MSFWGGCQFILCANAHLEGCSDWNQSQLAIAPFSVCWFVNNHFIWGSLSKNCFIWRSLWTPGFNRKWRPHIWLSKWSISFSRNRFLTCLFLQFNGKYKGCIHPCLSTVRWGPCLYPAHFNISKCQQVLEKSRGVNAYISIRLQNHSDLSRNKETSHSII